MRERGAALITVMLVVTVATVVAVEMAKRGGILLARTSLIAGAQQSAEYALGLEDWARHLLREDALRGAALDHRGEAWAAPLLELPVASGNLSGRIEDLSGRFNLNSLRTGDAAEQALAEQRFQRLLDVLGLPQEITPAVLDWLDADGQARTRGAEDGTYLRSDPPYRAANDGMTHSSELRLVAGFDAKSWPTLAPHVAALPEHAPVNVNAATPEVLASLDPTIDLRRARLLWRDGQARWRNADEFVAAAQITAFPAGAGFQSRYFVTLSEVALGDSSFRFFSLLSRDPTTGATRVLQRGRGDYLAHPLPSPAT